VATPAENIRHPYIVARNDVYGGSPVIAAPSRSEAVSEAQLECMEKREPHFVGC